MLELQDLKNALNITNAQHDGRLQAVLNGAIAEYEQLIGPLPNPVPANVRELILADAAGLHIAQQRGKSSPRAGLPGEDRDERERAPMLLYPRIRAYAHAVNAGGGPVFAFPPAEPWPRL